MLQLNTETGEYYDDGAETDESVSGDYGNNESVSGNYGNDSSQDVITDDVDYSKLYDWNTNPDGSQQKLNADGSISYEDPDGSTYTVKGNIFTTQSEGKTWNYDKSKNAFVDEAGKVLTNAPTGLLGKVVAAVRANPMAALGTAYGAIKSISSSNSGGYNKPVPKLDAVRGQIEYNDPNRRAGSSGRQYTTDTRYVNQGDTAGLAAAQAAIDAEKAGILAAYKPAAKEVNPYAGKMKTKWNAAAVPTKDTAPAGGIVDAYMEPPKYGINGTGINSGIAAIDVPQDKYVKPAYDGSDMEPRITQPVGPSSSIPKELENMIGQQKVKYAGANPNSSINIDPNSDAYAHGGIAMLAKGGEPRYLQGETDGMADKIPSNIDGDQEAALSHGEFVIPADVVSHLGNGNSDAGAQKLYQMMDRIREARTGTKEQGKEINPDKFMPGGLAKAYAGGGAVQGFNGASGSAVSSGGVPLDVSKTSSLSPWAGDYVTNMLGKTQALTSTPTATYKGPLTAGASDLQQQGFAGISDIASTGFDPNKFSTGTFNAQAANQYMNPYLKSVLDPQMEELRRQNAITNMGANAKLTQAGAYGGGRQAIMNAENNRNLMQEMNKTVGTGYSNAFDKAMAQFNTEQGRQFDVDKASEASRQYSADYGLKTAKDLLDAGATQRGIDSEGIAADKKQFEEQQADPYNRLEFQRKMLTDLPIGTTTTGVNQDAVSKMQSDISGLAALYEKLNKLIPAT